jgi:anti-sigma-K factor RskA
MATVMNDEQLEFSITRYLDGTLEPTERAALEARLSSDAQARAMLEEHRALTAMLRSHPLPEVRWERLAESISNAIDDQAEQTMLRVSWILRARSRGYVAVAASVVIAAALAVHFLRTPRGTPGPQNVQPPVQQVALEVQGPQEDQPQGPSVEEVSIGPGGSYAHASSLAPYADEIDTRPSRVALAAAAPVTNEQSSQPSPF